MSRSITVAGAVLGSVLALAVSASAKDYAGTALNIIPSGQYGGVPVPAGADEQAKMYDGLTPLFDQVTPEDLTKYFKSEHFGAGDSCPCRNEPVTRKGITITRDRFDVPHIEGRNRDDLSWAAGWVLIEDRGLLVAQGRYPARFAALDAPGIDAFSLVTGLKQVTVTKQADRIITRQQTRALNRTAACNWFLFWRHASRVGALCPAPSPCGVPSWGPFSRSPAPRAPRRRTTPAPHATSSRRASTAACRSRPTRATRPRCTTA
jgi:hypothetical protein